jgi:GWxTD domain-containing protein
MRLPGPIPRWRSAGGSLLMHVDRRTSSLLAFALLAALTAGSAHAAPSERRAREARALYDSAVEKLGRRTFESRRAAIADLERATSIAPREPEYQVLLARTYYQCGFLREARRRFDAVEQLDPRDVAAQYGLGQVWRRDWLKYLDTLSLARATEHFERAGRLDTARAEPWVLAASLRTEARDTSGALADAQRAAGADPRNPDAILALGAALWRAGRPDEGEARLREAIPRLPKSVRERFFDIAPVASEADTAIYNHLSAAGREEFARRFWTEHDPDLVTAQNEAQLEYWSRVAQAYFLFWNPRHREWDERGEVYVRYGPPARADYNPLDQLLYSRVGSSAMMFPMNVMIWNYPQLGMVVPLQDRLLSEYWMLPMTREYDPDPRPDPDSLAKLDALGTHDLRGVFPTLPPRTERVKLEGGIARFEGASGPRLLAALGAAATPGDSLVATAVVFDSTATERMRETRALSPSACAADRFRVADFADDLPPGRYWVGLEVRAGSRRGTLRYPVTLSPSGDALALSDVVVTCGTPVVLGPGMRLDANPAARVPPGSPLTAYFEIYRLTPGADGLAHYEYEYRVRTTDRDPRIWIQRLFSPRPSPPEIQTRSEQSNPGAMRRQFVSVPLEGLPPGRYRLEIRVRDLASGEEARGSAEFTRLSETQP